jgi:hypothetical protein
VLKCVDQSLKSCSKETYLGVYKIDTRTLLISLLALGALACFVAAPIAAITFSSSVTILTLQAIGAALLLAVLGLSHFTTPTQILVPPQPNQQASIPHSPVPQAPPSTREEIPPQPNQQASIPYSPVSEAPPLTQETIPPIVLTPPPQQTMGLAAFRDCSLPAQTPTSKPVSSDSNPNGLGAMLKFLLSGEKPK